MSEGPEGDEVAGHRRAKAKRWGIMVAACVLALAAALGLVMSAIRGGGDECVSVLPYGAKGNGDSWDPCISADGRFVAFTSEASNLVPGDTNRTTDVFAHDRRTGRTERVSVSSQGVEGNARSQDASISVDGRFVAFVSDGSNLVPGDTNGVTDVFVRDRETGATERRSSSSGRFEPLTVPGLDGMTDSCGVLLFSEASDLVPGDVNSIIGFLAPHIESGTTGRVMVLNGRQHWSALISGDGRFIAFDSADPNLLPGDTNGKRDVFVHDRQAGVTERVTGRAGGHGAAISADGRFVAYALDDSTQKRSALLERLLGPKKRRSQVYVHDRGPQE